MDFLRRLHPRHAEAPGAVRPDLGAWRAAGLPRQGVACEDIGTTDGPPAPGDDGRSSMVAAAPTFAAAVPLQAEAPVAKHPRRADAAAAAQTAHGPPQPTGPDVIAVAPRDRPTPSASPAPPPAPPPALRPDPARTPAPAVVSVPPARPAAAAWPAAPARAAAAPAAGVAPLWPARPLRAEVQPLRPAAAEPAAPTVVQVTIDRIDLRLPPERAAAAAPRRARPAPAVALADYLRDRDGERR